MGNHESPFLNPDLWQDLVRREDDIIIATYAKFGPLRMQAIINQLINHARRDQIALLPWVELRHERARERIDAINTYENRHILRSHLPAKEVYNSRGNYIFVGRDPRDLIFNLFHFLKYVPENWHNHFSYYGFERPNIDDGFISFWNDWINQDGAPIWPYFSYLKSWWDRRHEPNILFIHFINFKFNMEKELRRIATFLDLNINSNDWSNIITSCSYDKITKLSLDERQIDSPFWNGGSPRLRTKSTMTERWNDCFDNDNVIEMESKICDFIGPAGKDWLLKGLRKSADVGSNFYE